MPSYLIHSRGDATLARYVAPDTLFVFDLDGTLAPNLAEHGAAQVAKPVRAALLRLVGLAGVAVISGRSRKDAVALLGFQPHLVIGNHGAEWPGKNSRNWQFVQRCLKWREQLHDALFYEPGVEIEFKGESLSLHYGKAADPAMARSLIHAAIDSLEPAPRRMEGKCAVNVVPAEALDRGAALAAAMDRLGATRAVFFGDDESDEELFKLKRDGVFGVQIGNDGETAAPYYLKQQSELLGLLNSIVEILELHRDEEIE